jgi:hypothetical protein
MGVGVTNNNCCPPVDPCETKVRMPSSRRCEAGYAQQVDPHAFIQDDCPPQQYQPPPCEPQNVCTNIGEEANNQNMYDQNYDNQAGWGNYPNHPGYPQGYPQSHLQKQKGFNNVVKGKLDIKNPDNRHTTRVVAIFGGSQQEFQNKDRQPTWRPKSLNIFSNRGDVNRVVALELKANVVKNTFPFPVGLNLSGFEGMVHTEGGKALVYIPGNTTLNLKDTHVWYPKKAATSLIMQNYGHMHPDSIRSNIVPIPNQSYSLVHKDNVVPKIISLNQDKLGVNFSNYPVKADYHFIENKLIERCLDEINTQVFSKIGDIISDFSGLQATIFRADGFDWDDTTHIPGIGNKNQINTQNITSSYNTVEVGLSIQYAFAKTFDEEA